MYKNFFAAELAPAIMRQSNPAIAKGETPLKKQITRIFGFCLLIACTLTARAEPQQQLFFDGFDGAYTCAPVAPCPGWTVTPQDGAQGGGKVTTTMAYAGQASYQIQKTNAVGYIDVALNQSFTVDVNNTYTVHLRYHSSDAPLSAMLLIRLAGPTDTNLGYDTVLDGSEGYENQASIRNSTNAWFDRVVDTSLAPGVVTPRILTPHVVLYGNPSTVYIDSFEIVVNNPTFSNAAGPSFLVPATTAEVKAALAARPEATATTGTYNGHPVLFVNNGPVPPLIYKALLSQKTGNGAPDPYTVGDYAGFHSVGLDTVVMAAPLAFGPNQSLEAGTSWTGMNGDVPVMDFTSLDANLLALLQKNPNANIILDLWVYPNQQWLQTHPGESFTINGKTWPSDGSLHWRDDAASAIAAMVNHVRTGLYHKAVMGWFLTTGIDGQDFQPLDTYDRSAVNTTAFRTWLSQNYKNLTTLNQAWQANYANYNAIDVPADPVPEPTPTITGLSARSSYLAFRRAQSWALRDYWAGVIKTAANKPVVVLTYAAPLDQGFVQSKFIDGAGMQPAYQYRASGLPDGFKPISPDSLHGKILFSELDLRSWVAASGTELERAWTPIPDDINEWREENRKLIGGALADGFGAWYYDMDQYFNDPYLMREIEFAVQTWKQSLLTAKSAFHPDVCVVVSDDAFDYVTGAQSPIDGAILGLMQLQTSGVPFDVQYLSDVVSNPQLQQYKVYVFWHLARLTAVERAVIAKFAQTPSTLVWEYDTGFVSDFWTDPAAMDATVGMHIATSDMYLRETPLLLSGIPLTNGLLPFQSMSELELSKMTLDLPNFDSQPAEEILARPRPFAVDDPQATPLAEFVPIPGSPGSVAIASKNVGAATSIYIASPYGLGGDLLNAIAVKAGAYAAGVPGPAIHMNGEFISLHAMTSGTYTITLPPGKHTVIDAITGTVLAANVASSYTLQVQPQTTYWLRFQ
jgi:hypothetical protein